MELVLTKEYITGLIERKGMSKAKFAKQMGVQRQNLDALLESKKDINTVIKMSELLGLSLNEFLYGKNEVQISGFIKFNGSIKEIHTREDIEAVLSEIGQCVKNCRNNPHGFLRISFVPFGRFV